MSRRSLGSTALAAVLLTSGLVPLLGTAHAGSCASWTDVKDDAKTNQFAPLPLTDSNMDIVGASVQTVGDRIVAQLKIQDLFEGGYSDAGDQYVVQVDVGGTKVRFVAERSELAETGRVGGLTASAPKGAATAVFDYYDNTVTISTTQAEFDKAAGKAAAGLTATTLSAATASQVNSEGYVPYDSSSAPAGSTYVVGEQCAPAIPAAVLDMPSAGCADVTDGPADGTPVVASPATAPNEPGLDITAVSINATADSLDAYVKVTDLGDKPANFQGDRFELTFKSGAKTYIIAAGRMTAGKSVTAVPTRGSVNGTTNAALKVRGVFDQAANMVVIRLDRASLDTVNGSPIADGDTVTDVSAKTVALQPALQFTADTAQATAATDRTYTVGKDKCFGPPPAVLANRGRTSVQYTDAAALAAKLTDADGAALAGRTVRFAIGAKSVTAKTGSDGIAKASLNPGVVAGAYSLVTSFAGDSKADAVTLTTPFSVVAEKTRIVLSVAKSGTRRTVTAKLLDDDGRPVAGQTITWYVNGKKVTTSKTTSAGIATFKTAKPTQTVKAVFATVTGKYTGSTASKKV